MKKIMIALCAVMMGVATANAGCTWSWWTGDDKATSDSKGCALGLATERANVVGAQVAICYNKAKAVNGGAQAAFGYNRTDTLRNGVQLAFWNAADSSALQLGLLCFNKTGFLPFFVFFNFDKAMFGGNK